MISHKPHRGIPFVEPCITLPLRGPQSFGQVLQSFGQPVQSFGQPVQSFGQQVQSFGQPVLSFGQPVQSFGQQKLGADKTFRYSTNDKLSAEEWRPIDDVSSRVQLDDAWRDVVVIGRAKHIWTREHSP